MSFADLGVTRPVADALSKRGITAPFAVQKLVIEDVLDGHDVLVQSPTGSGKTLAFAIPLVECVVPDDRLPAALVLAPTRELALQIEEELRDIAAARGLRVAAVFGGVGLEAQSRKAAKAHILVATPGRLEDLLNRRAFSLGELRILVIDEADRMLDMGFKPAVDRIVRQTPDDRQTLFFSATLEAAAGQLAQAYTYEPRRHVHEPVEEDKGEISHRFVHLSPDAKMDALVSELRDSERGRTLVFVRTKHGADRLVRRLATHGVKAIAMHGNKSQRQREQALTRFESGRVDTLVATDVAARGIDVDRISHVINFDPPADGETYVHRIGRTGRAGRRGVGITFHSPDQHHDIVKLAGQLGLSHDLHNPDRTSPQKASARRPASRNNHRSHRRPEPRRIAN